MSRFRCPAKIMPDNVTRCLVRPVQQGTPGITSKRKTITPNPEAIYGIPVGTRPALDAFKPTRRQYCPALARA